MSSGKLQGIPFLIRVENGRQMRDDADVVLEPFPIGQLLVDLADEPRLEEGDDDGTIVLGA